MTKPLSLNLEECSNIDLSSTNIDWGRFNLQCVRYFNKYKDKSKTIKLKTNLAADYNVIDEILNNVSNFNYFEDTNDVLTRVRKLYETYELRHCEMPQESDIIYYNSDLVSDFPYIIDCITIIENFINVKFGHVKLRYVPPRDAELVHVDYTPTRYHIPIVTNENSFFVCDDRAYHMHGTKKVYILDSSKPHTVVNACGVQGRLHLIGNPIDMDFKFSVEKIEAATRIFCDRAEHFFRNVPKADYELNKEIYKIIGRKLGELKNLL